MVATFPFPLFRPSLFSLFDVTLREGHFSFLGLPQDPSRIVTGDESRSTVPESSQGME